MLPVDVQRPARASRLVASDEMSKISQEGKQFVQPLR
ncbi:hypothetical protein ABIB95_007682 [Bradyrhizobium sp. LA2.1]